MHEPKQTNWWKLGSITALLGIICGVLITIFPFQSTQPTNLLTNVTAQELPAQRQAPEESAQKDLKIKGNKNSKIYHLPGCASYDRISPKNVVWFKTTEEAEAAGYRIAKNC